MSTKCKKNSGNRLSNKLENKLCPLVLLIKDCLERFKNSEAPPRERILAVASELFYKQGIHAVGVESIAEAAGTNKMTLYRHFKSKDELIAAYLRNLAEDGEIRWQKMIDDSKGDPKAHLKIWVKDPFLGADEPYERGCAFVNAAAELPDMSHPGRKVIEEYKAKYVERLLELCTKAKYKNPKKLSERLHLLFEGAVVTSQYVGIKTAFSNFTSIAETLLNTHEK